MTVSVLRRAGGALLTVGFLVAVLSAGAAALFAGCPGGTVCNGLGQPCTVFCCPGLACTAALDGRGGVCTRSCQCAPGEAVCNSLTIKDGCPPDAGVCVAFDPSGSGQCINVCDREACPPGGSGCTTAPGGSRVCLAPDFGFIRGDAGSDGESDTKRPD